jgi:AraC-like DNA-binding protein
MQAMASEMAEQAPGSEVVATRLAEILFIQVLRAHIAAGPERNKGWLRAIFDPQIGNALSAIHDKVNAPWTVESLAAAARMSRSAFAARFKELLGQTPLEYVTEWRMQKAIQLLQQRDRKLMDVARSVGYESDAAFSKAFKRVVGTNPGAHSNALPTPPKIISSKTSAKSHVNTPPHRKSAQLPSLPSLTPQK